MSKNHTDVIEWYRIEQPSRVELAYTESYVTAGFPSPAENHLHRVLDLNDLMIKHPSSTFLVRVIGESMINAHIMPHDILVVDRSLPLVDNKIAVMRVNDEFTVKRVRFEQEQMILVAENDAYPPMYVTPEMDVELFGVVTFVIHKT